MEEAYIYSNHSKIHESSVATSNPNKNGFSSPLSWRAQAYKMENGRERDTKRKMELFPQALALLQALQIALLELQNVQDPFPLAKTEEKEPTCHISEYWRLAEGSHRQAVANKQGAKPSATARRCPVTARRFVTGAPGWRFVGAWLAVCSAWRLLRVARRFLLTFFFFSLLFGVTH